MLDYYEIDLDKINTISDIINMYNDNNIKEYLQKLFGSLILSYCIEETDELYLVNMNLLSENLDYQNNLYSVVKRSPNLVIEKKSDTIIIELYNNNGNNKKINNHNWSDIKVSYIYPGLSIVLFNLFDKWLLISNDTLDAEINLTSYGTLNSILDKLKTIIDIELLNKNNYYHIIYQNNRSKNHLDNNLINNSYCEFIFVNSYTKYNFIVNEEKIVNINKINELYFSCLDELIIRLDYISYENKINKKLTYAGFNLSVYKDNKNIGNFNLYNDVYNMIKKNISINDNIYKIYLELYQKNNLTEILPYISKYSSEIIHRLNMSMKTLSREILNIYHTTRKKKHQDLYKLLPELYKKILYGLHGVYINSRKKDIINRKPVEYDETKSITVHDVYYFIKELTAYQLYELFKEREELLKNTNFNNIMNRDCIYILTQSKLMFNK